MFTPATISMSSGCADAADARPRRRTRRGSTRTVRGRGCGTEGAALPGDGDGEDQLTGCFLLHRHRFAARRIDELRVDEAAGAEVHAVLSLAFAPEGDPESPMPIASLTRAPQPSSRRVRNAGSPPPGSPATSTRSMVDPARSTPRSAARSIRCAAYEGVSTAAVGRSISTARRSRSVLPVPIGMWVRPSRSNDASAAPATNGPAL